MDLSALHVNHTKPSIHRPPDHPRFSSMQVLPSSSAIAIESLLPERLLDTESGACQSEAVWLMCLAGSAINTIEVCLYVLLRLLRGCLVVLSEIYCGWSCVLCHWNSMLLAHLSLIRLLSYILALSFRSYATAGTLGFISTFIILLCWSLIYERFFRLAARWCQWSRWAPSRCPSAPISLWAQ